MQKISLMFILLLTAGCAPALKIISTAPDEYLIYDTGTGRSWWSSRDNVSEELTKKASTFCGEAKVVEEVQGSFTDSSSTVPEGSASLRFRCSEPSL